ncbi:translocation/assembly module TamB domain-containing protein [Altericista sp. CCNU0014]|uniref:translocation/assembly module TamB domain-containing protein n=1 Tax=Altericista sp. CCNU0014 TaxID=3082949 RepID=UPI00384DCD67
MSYSSPDPSPRGPRMLGLALFSRPVLGGLLVLGALCGVAAWRGLFFIERELSPRIEEGLLELLNRPVKLGPLKRYSLSELEFGRSTIAPHTTQINGKTVVDRDRAVAESVVVRFNPWTVPFARTLGLDVILNRPTVYLDQSPDDRWIGTRLSPLADAGGIKIQLNSIRALDATVTLDPTIGASRVLQRSNAIAKFKDNNRNIDFRGDSRIDSGGRVALNGNWKPPQQTLELTAQTQNLEVAPLLPLLPPSPVRVSTGRFDGRLRLAYAPQQALRLSGKGKLQKAEGQWIEQSIAGKANQIDLDVAVAVPANRQPIVQGKAFIQGGEGQVPEKLILANGRSRRQTARDVSGTLAFLGASQIMQLDLKGALAAGGKAAVKGNVRLPLESANLLIQAQNVPAALFDRAYRLPLQVSAGRVGGNIAVRLRKNQRPSLQGVASLDRVNAAVPGIPQPFLETNGLVRLSGLTATLEGVTTRYGSVPVKARGSIDPDRGYNLAAQTEPIEVNTALKTLKVGALPFPVAGQVQASEILVGGAIAAPVLTGSVQSIGTATLDRIPVRDVSAQFRLASSLLTVSDITARPVEGGKIAGRATLQIQPEPSQSILNAQFEGSGLSGDAIARLYRASPGFAIGLVGGSALVSGPVSDIRTVVQFKAPGGAYPTVGRAIVRQGRTTLENVIAQVKGGSIRVNGLVADGRVNLDATLPGIDLTSYSPELRGALAGQLAITGPLAGFSTQTARARGALQFSKGLSVLQDPLKAQIRWNGQQILVDRATAPGFEARGIVGAQLQGPQGPQITTLNLDLLARRFELNRLSALGLSQNPLYGLADLNGKLTGTLSAPRLTSNVEISNLKVSDLAFEPLMAGRFDFNTTQGLTLDIGGTRDRVQVALDARQLPIAIDIRRDKATIVGQRATPDTFGLVLTDVPVAALNEFPQIAQNIGSLSGTASGTLALNLRTLDTDGTFVVEQPGLGRPGYGRFTGDRLTGQFRYAKGVATLTQARLVQGENQYQLDATLTDLTNPQVSGRLAIAQARVEDLLSVAASFSNALAPKPAEPNLGSATNVETTPVNVSDVPLWQQLQRLAEVDEFLALRRQENGDGAIPSWEDLKGLVSGEVRFSGSARAGLSGTFNLAGRDWTLEDYRIDRVVAQGRLDPSGLVVEPLTLTSGESVASFTGRVGGDRQAGQLVVRQLPIDSIADLLDLPVNITGKLNGSANLVGRWNNPSVEGQFSIDEGVLNRAKIQNASTQFNYKDARLVFDGTANIDSPEPIRISGNVPYALPFSAVKPASDQIDVSMSVKDQGLALVNIVSDQVAWVDGKGNLDLKVRGTLEKPLLRGGLVLQDATLRSPTFPEPLTNVTGSVQFNSDRLTANELSGRYNKGEVIVKGSLPIFDEKLPVETPLSVALNNTALNVRGLYRGQVNGDLNVTGSAFRPAIGGFVALDNGEVLLAAASAAQASSPTPATGGGAASVSFEGLQVRLGENIRILQPPVLSFIASGQVDLNGSIDAPRPNGIVRFRKGNVYLFTTLFRVDERRENFAQFTPAYGLDPLLNLSLRTTVTEVAAAGRATNLNEFEDIQAGTLGSIESVRVRANIQGRASQLNTRFSDILELTSTPGRTQNEILALLSGGIAQSLEAGDAQGAIVNFASSAFLNRFQSLVDDVLGSRASFRLFPLLTPVGDNRNARSTLNLGAEFGYDITDRFSVSLLQIVTDTDESPQLNLSYDFTDQLRVRSSVNFEGDAVGILEYRLRF